LKTGPTIKLTIIMPNTITNIPDTNTSILFDNFLPRVKIFEYSFKFVKSFITQQIIIMNPKNTQNDIDVGLITGKNK
jgi:hypothetical protein